jgi:putative N6-adenine-specific DNA methylase
MRNSWKRRYRQKRMLNISAITHKGFEDVCSEEIKGLLKTGSVVDGRFVEFEIEDVKDLLRLYYTSQSSEFILLKLSEGKTVREAMSGVDESVVQWIGDETSFVVKCERETEVEDVQSIESEIGDKIKSMTGARFTFKNPELRVIIYVTEEKTVIGIDFAVIDLSKRQHKIYKSNVSLKGTLAFCLYRLAESPRFVLDPFCGSGEIILEAALYESKKPVNFFQKDELAFVSNPKFDNLALEKFFSVIDKKEKKQDIKLLATDKQLRHVMSVKNNAKIAGVDKYVDTARMDIEWLDSKFDDGEISHIITQPPELSKNKEDSQIKKVLSEFFYQSDFILSKKGRIICINRNASVLKGEAEKQKFRLVEERKVWSGRQEYDVVVFSKDVSG